LEEERKVVSDKNGKQKEWIGVIFTFSSTICSTKFLDFGFVNFLKASPVNCSLKIPKVDNVYELVSAINNGKA
jgi:hypothetical protein